MRKFYTISRIANLRPFFCHFLYSDASLQQRRGLQWLYRYYKTCWAWRNTQKSRAMDMGPTRFPVAPHPGSVILKSVSTNLSSTLRHTGPVWNYQSFLFHTNERGYRFLWMGWLNCPSVTSVLWKLTVSMMNRPISMSSLLTVSTKNFDFSALFLPISMVMPLRPGSGGLLPLAVIILPH